MTILKSSCLGIAAVAMAGVLAVSAADAEVAAEAAPTVKLSLKGVDLTTSQGLKTMQRKVRSTAVTVCPAAFESRGVNLDNAARDCRRNAIAVADAEIDQARELQVARMNRDVQTAMAAKPLVGSTGH